MGTPQGSILGPLHFTLYINDLPSICGDDIKMHMYADDTVIHTHENDVNEVVKNVSVCNGKSAKLAQ